MRIAVIAAATARRHSRTTASAIITPTSNGTSTPARCVTTANVSHHFDTLRVVKLLQEQGFSSEQSEAVLRVVQGAMTEAWDAQTQILATKADHIALKAELSEKVFNSTLKFDIAQRHMRELLERDFNNLKHDIRTLERADIDKIEREIADVDKKILLQKQEQDVVLNELRVSMEKVEKRILQYAIGFAGSIMAVGAALMRLVM